jgi:hypothetical protein
MDYTPEQREILRRLGEISAQFDAAASQQQAAQAAMYQDILEMGTALIAAINHSTALVTLHKRHGDVWREFLDTLN